MFWLVKDKRGYILFFGAKPEFQKNSGIYISAYPNIGKIPEDAVDALGIDVTKPTNVKLVLTE